MGTFVILLITTIVIVISYFVRKPKIITLTGTVIEKNIGHPNTGFSFVTIKDQYTGEATELRFDTRAKNFCKHSDPTRGEECFHGKASEFDSLINDGDIITIRTRNKDGVRDVYELNEVIEIETND